LFPVLQECRVIKSALELDVLRYVNKISSEAHMELMKSIKPGLFEYQMESMFRHHTYYHGGCRNMSYTCIGCSGENGAILHYGHAGEPNSKMLVDGEMVLFDMGAEYHCYCSDITRCYPTNGKFTEDQKDVYNSVLAAQNAVLATMKPGVSWLEMHRLALKTICEQLKRRGFLQGEVDDMMAHDVGFVFMPHGLGHFLGLDTHDVGGYSIGHPTRSTQKSFKKLRTARVLQEGMVITVEPGIYFIDVLLDQALSNPDVAKFLVAEKISKFRKFGGVRIEDDIIVTATGCENMTIAPRTVEQIEALMAKKS